MNCHELRQLIDSFLNDELLVETNHEVLQHLGECSDCRAFHAYSSEIRSRMRKVVVADSRIDPTFAANLRADLRRSVHRQGFWHQLTGRAGIAGLGLSFAAAAIILFAGFLLLRPSPMDKNVVETDRNGVVDAIQLAWSELAETAIGDHQNCAVKFALGEDPISLDDAAAKYGPVNKDLDSAIITAVKTEFAADENNKVELIEGHSCLYNGRRFAHIVLKAEGKVVSVLITDTDIPGQDGQVMTDEVDGKLTASGMRIGKYALFVVSEMNAPTNDRVARSIVPALRRHIISARA